MQKAKTKTITAMIQERMMEYEEIYDWSCSRHSLRIRIFFLSQPHYQGEVTAANSWEVLTTQHN